MPWIECHDGWSVSVAAGRGKYCSPREDDATYKSVELGFPTKGDSLINEYAENPREPTNTVYGYVPSYLLLHLFEKHGGIKNGTLPKLDLESADMAAEHSEWLLKNQGCS